MRSFRRYFAVIFFSLTVAGAQERYPRAGTLVGEWQLASTVLGISTGERLTFKSGGDQFTGNLRREGENVPVTGNLKGQDIRIEFKIGHQESVYVGRLAMDTMSGTFTVKGRDQTLSGTWTAKKSRTDKPSVPRTVDFIPSEFHRELSAEVPPVLTIWPGDIVRTKSVDAGGQDERSQQRVAGGNPLTGPFYVEGAMSGDVLAIYIKRLRINRDWAISDSGLVGRALTTEYASENKQNWNTTRWHLDAARQLGTLVNPPEHLKNFAVPLRPVLGCVGVAPGPGDAEVSTRDSGYLGGNMDFNRINEGTTVYLRVHQPGALLYLGDAHALQGDGELNGNALETSMDIEFTVDVLRDKNIGTPRAEDKDYLMAIGMEGSLDDAFQTATSELTAWLQSDYKLSSAEAAIVLGASVEYNISEVADRNVGVVAKIRKSSLSSLLRD
jgi:amidase